MKFLTTFVGKGFPLSGREIHSFTTEQLATDTHRQHQTFTTRFARDTEKTEKDALKISRRAAIRETKPIRFHRSALSDST
jgi:hypothetical protein